MALFVVRRAFHGHAIGASPPKSPVPQPHSILDPYNDVKFLFPETVEEELELYATRDLRQSKIDRTMRKFALPGMSSSKGLLKMETTRNQQVVGVAKITSPEPATANAMGTSSQPKQQSLPLKISAKKGSGDGDTVGDWIKARSDLNSNIAVMGTLNTWFHNKPLDKLEARVCKRMQTTHCDTIVSAHAIPFPPRASVLQASVSSTVEIIVNEFIKNNRWTLFRIFTRSCDLAQSYLMPITEFCRLLEECSGIIKSADFDINLTSWKGNLSQLSTTQLRKVIHNKATEKLTSDNKIDYRYMLDDVKARTEFRRRLLRDSFRRRSEAAGDHSQSGVHQNIGMSVANGDPLAWITNNAALDDHTRRRLSQASAGVGLPFGRATSPSRANRRSSGWGSSFSEVRPSLNSGIVRRGSSPASPTNSRRCSYHNQPVLSSRKSSIATTPPSTPSASSRPTMWNFAGMNEVPIPEATEESELNNSVSAPIESLPDTDRYKDEALADEMTE